MLLAPGQQFGSYLINREIGHGSFGTVYAVTDLLLNRESALKVVQNQDPNQFLAHYEGQILHKCRHEHIVTVNFVNVIPLPSGQPYAAIDMELCSGSAIDLVEKQYVSIKTSIKVLIDVLFALEHTHRQGVLHRDIKPANILKSGNRYKLGDFGLSLNGLAGSGNGSPVYCAPEVLNKQTTDVSTDIFSLGITLFQLCNSYPDLTFWIKDENPIRAGKVIETIGFSDFVPDRIRKICRTACAIDPNKRYKSAFEMRQALEKLKVIEDWNRLSPYEWEANVKGKTHKMIGSPHPLHINNYMINGRRKTINCSSHNDLTSLQAAQNEWIKDNTLK